MRPDGDYLDGTFGGGGYSRAVLDVPPHRLIGIDRDPEAVARGRALAEKKARLSRCWKVGSVTWPSIWPRLQSTSSMASFSISASRRSRSTTPERGFLVCRRRSARHAHGGERRERCGCGQRRRRAHRNLPRSSIATARSGRAGGLRRRSSSGGARRRSREPASLRRLLRVCSAGAARSIRQPGPFRRFASM